MAKAAVDSFVRFLIAGIALSAAAVAILSPSSFGRAEEYDVGPDGQPRRTRPVPGLPQMQLPPAMRGQGAPGETLGRAPIERRAYPNGTSEFPPTIVGPGGVIKPGARPPEQAKKAAPPKKVLTPAERATQIRKALAPKPSLAFVRRHTLDDLYGKLAVAKDVDEAKGLATLIGNIWMRSGSDTANLLMQRAVQAIEKKDYPVALDLLDRLVALKPSWAEAWNKRASVRFYTKDYDGAMGDVEHVLKLEPKHFGALAGMATILQRTGFDKRALEVFRRSLAIYPHQPEVEKIVEKLTLDVEGQGI